jgi:hypothetical protein
LCENMAIINKEKISLHLVMHEEARIHSGNLLKLLAGQIGNIVHSFKPDGAFVGDDIAS